MNYKIMIIGLLTLTASNIHSDSDFGHRFGASGYINNMPLYFKDDQGTYSQKLPYHEERQKKHHRNHKHRRRHRKNQAAAMGRISKQ